MVGNKKPQLQVARFPRNAACAVTTSWDDNYSTNMEVQEILDSMGLKGTFYVDPGGPSAKLRGTYYENEANPESHALTDSQLRALASTQEVGSHAWSHANLRLCHERKIREELVTSKEYIETITGHPAFGLAYPHGQHSPTTEMVAEECGYLFARTTELGHIDFPPANLYSWGISVEALARSGRPKKLVSKRLLSRLALAYLKNVTSDSRNLALRLFRRAQQAHGVWHLFGHSNEFLRSPNKEQFLEVCRYVAGKEDVWYATNGMLFLNEMIRKNVDIKETHDGRQFSYDVRANFPLREVANEVRMPLRLVVPKEWGEKFKVEITTGGPAGFEVGRISGSVWIDISDNEGNVRVERM